MKVEAGPKASPRYLEDESDRQDAAAWLIAVGEPSWHETGLDRDRQDTLGTFSRKIVDPWMSFPGSGVSVPGKVAPPELDSCRRRSESYLTNR